MLDTTISNYRITGKLGGDDASTVWLGEDTTGGKTAIRVLKPEVTVDQELKRYFTAEAGAVNQLNHLNIARLLHYDQIKDQLVMISEYIDGKPLDEYLRASTGLPQPQRSIPFFNKILDACGYAHQKGLTHKNISPSNIMVSTAGEPEIINFGVASISGIGAPYRKKTVASQAYSSPEQVRNSGEIDSRADIYSLGVLLYTLLTGKIVYDDIISGLELREKISYEPLPKASAINPMVSPALDAVIARATAKNPAERFQTCGDFKWALLDALQSQQAAGNTHQQAYQSPYSTSQGNEEYDQAESEHEDLPENPYYISSGKFIALYFVSFGLVGMYWQYKTWRFMKEKYELDIMPFWRSVFSIFFVHRLYEDVSYLAEKKDCPPKLRFNASSLATAYVVVTIVSRIVDRVTDNSDSVDSMVIAMGILLLHLVIMLFLVLPPVKAFSYYLMKAYGENPSVKSVTTGEVLTSIVGMLIWLIFAVAMLGAAMSQGM